MPFGLMSGGCPLDAQLIAHFPTSFSSHTFHTFARQDSRPNFLKAGVGGATSAALAELGMQLSWAGRMPEAVEVLMRQASGRGECRRPRVPRLASV